jgi:hypothetical protein
METSNYEHDSDEMITCASPGCGCKIEPSETYCSEICKNQQKDGPCHCGHFDCRAEQEGM